MPGGLLQLVAVGAQNTFINGNPSMTYFNAMYKRYSNFAMEQFRLDFRGTDLNLAPGGPKSMRVKLARYGDMVHDCYLCVNIPDIYSPIVKSQILGTDNAYAYQFQWVKNLGYNMIQEVSLLINGTSIVTMTGEWMKLMTYMKYDATKRGILDQMVGNIPELYDPANANGRTSQYPNSVQPADSTVIPSPSIPGRQLTIPLPFWFCEEIGQSLPLVALTEAEVEIVITFRNIYQLFTVVDPRDLNNLPINGGTFGQRIPGIPGDSYLGMQNFLSPPDFNGFPTNLELQNWNLNPYVEGNYIFLTETERAHVAGFERTYLITQPRVVVFNNQYGYNNTLIPMFNLCTRIVAVYQRTDLALLNQWDNYTNWINPTTPPLDTNGYVGPIVLFTSGGVNPLIVTPQDILQEANLVLDGKDRFTTKNLNFFRYIENYKYSTGDTSILPGVYQYSFAINPNEITQPSGTLNGSMFNKTFLQYTLQVPPVNQDTTANPPVCVVKSTVFNPVPTPVPNPLPPTPPGFPPLYQQGQVLTIYNPPTENGQVWQYNTTVYIESYNFLKVTSGIANIIFST